MPKVAIEVDAPRGKRGSREWHWGQLTSYISQLNVSPDRLFQFLVDWYGFEELTFTWDGVEYRITPNDPGRKHLLPRNPDA